MLELTKQIGEKVVLEGGIVVTVVAVQGDEVVFSIKPAFEQSAAMPTRKKTCTTSTGGSAEVCD